jgi:hypothetical protein
VPARKHVDNVSDRVSAVVHHVDSHKRNLYKRSSKDTGIERLPQPESLEKWVIPDRLRYFMGYDSGKTLEAHHFALFTTTAELKLLPKCKSIHLQLWYFQSARVLPSKCFFRIFFFNIPFFASSSAPVSCLWNKGISEASEKSITLRFLL